MLPRTYVVDGTPVFLTLERYAALIEEVTPSVQSAKHGNRKAQDDAQADLFLDFLREKKKKDCSQFHSDWVNLYLDAEEARRHVWTLLSDYRDLYGHITLSYQVFDRLSNVYDVVEINHFSTPPTWWSRFWHGMKNRKFMFRFFTSEIINIRGTIDDFSITLQSGVLQFTETEMVFTVVSDAPKVQSNRETIQTMLDMGR